MDAVEFTLERVDQTVFPSEYVQSVQVSEPIPDTDTLIEVHSDAREEHDGMLVYPLGTFGPNVEGASNNLLYSAGWHFHDSDALNICRGSNIPSFLAQNPDVATGILRSVTEHRARLIQLSGSQNWELEWRHGGIAEGTMQELLEQIDDNLQLYLEKHPDTPANEEFELGFQICRHLCHKLMINNEISGDLVGEATLTLKHTQLYVPEQKRLAIHPCHYDGYSIPFDVAHCRSLLHEELRRDAETSNQVVFVTVSEGL